MQKPYLLSLIALATALLSGCINVSEYQKEVVEYSVVESGNMRSEKETVVRAESEDKCLEKQKTVALQKIDFFKNAFKSKRSDQEFSIKIAFVDPQNKENVEHMWVVINSVSNDLYSGLLDNTPHMISSYQYGQEVIAKESQIEDRLIINSGEEEQGGFSMECFKNIL